MLGDEYLILFLTAAAQKQLVVPVEVSMGARKNILQLCNRKISASWTENAAEKMTSEALEEIEMKDSELQTTAEVHARQIPARRYVDYLIFTFCAGLYLLPFMRFVLLNCNEGSLVEGAVRIVHGQVFARDFLEVMGPGTFYWLAGFFKIFGVTFLAARICLFIVSLGTGLSMYFLTRRICAKYWTLPCIVLAGTYFGMQWPGISHHVDSNFFALLSVACIVVWQEKRWSALLLAAGVMAGFTMCILQPKGMLLLFALLLWLWMQTRRHTAPVSSLGIVAGGYLVVVAIVLVYFWSRAALGSLIYANVVWPAQSYSVVNKVPYALGLFSQYWKHWTIAQSGYRWTMGMASVLIAPFMLVAALPAIVPILWIRQGWKKVSPEVVLYLLCGYALWLSEIHRKDIYHLVFGSPLLLILCIYFLGESRRKAADLVLQILSIAAFLLAIVNLFQVVTAHSVKTRVGSVAMYKDDPVLEFLDSRANPGEEIFVYPFAPMYYFLSSTTNPTRYSLLEYNYNKAAEFQEVIQVLDRRRVRYVIWDTNFEAKMAAVVFPECPPMPSSRYLMEPYLESHYNLVKDVDGVRIVERKREDHANR
jgi:hypothetical protein